MNLASCLVSMMLKMGIEMELIADVHASITVEAAKAILRMGAFCHSEGRLLDDELELCVIVVAQHPELKTDSDMSWFTDELSRMAKSE